MLIQALMFGCQFKETDKISVMNTLEYVKMEGKEEGLAEGFAKGQAEERRNAVLALLKNTDFSVAKIASVLNVSEAFVKKVKDESRIG